MWASFDAEPKDFYPLFNIGGHTKNQNPLPIYILLLIIYSTRSYFIKVLSGSLHIASPKWFCNIDLIFARYLPHSQVLTWAHAQWDFGKDIVVLTIFQACPFGVNGEYEDSKNQGNSRIII